MTLAAAETCFSLLREQLRNAAPGVPLDLGVSVAERQPEPHGQAASHVGLANAHHTDQRDAAPGQGGGQAIHGQNLAQRLPRCRGVTTLLKDTALKSNGLIAVNIIRWKRN